MPKRSDIQSILLLGSGPIIIGQAAEFDYSGTQAVRALREEGYRVILVNSNPATIMTDPDLADATYIEPITPEWVERVIEVEKPDAILPTMGGQTALNVALELFDRGVLEKHGVELIGANARAIRMAEDRSEFAQAMARHRARRAARRFRPHAGRGARARGGHRLPGHHPSLLHDGRHRRGDRLQPGGVRGAGPLRPGAVAGARGADRPLGDRLERVRAGGDARRRGQRRDHLLHRELRRDGRTHRRLHHGGAGADAFRRRVPEDARRRHRHHPRDRGGGGRLQRAVRGESRRTASCWWWR